jgi:hypothetical protein
MSVGQELEIALATTGSTNALGSTECFERDHGAAAYVGGKDMFCAWWLYRSKHSAQINEGMPPSHTLRLVRAAGGLARVVRDSFVGHWTVFGQREVGEKWKKINKN